MRTLQDSIEVINVSSTANQRILLKYLIISKSGLQQPQFALLSKGFMQYIRSHKYRECAQIT